MRDRHQSLGPPLTSLLIQACLPVALPELNLIEAEGAACVQLSEWGLSAWCPFNTWLSSKVCWTLLHLCWNLYGRR